MKAQIRPTHHALRTRLTAALGAALLAASASTSPAAAACDDYMTAGGFVILTVPPGQAELPNDRGNFGASGGLRKGKFWGTLNYIDHQTGMHVQGVKVTGYTCVDKRTREIRGQCKIDGVRGYTYTLKLRDFAEPGRQDHFCLELSTGYVAGGLLPGGNVQLHGGCLAGPNCPIDPPVEGLCGTLEPVDL